MDGASASAAVASASRKLNRGIITEDEYALITDQIRIAELYHIDMQLLRSKSTAPEASSSTDRQTISLLSPGRDLLSGAMSLSEAQSRITEHLVIEDAAPVPPPPSPPPPPGSAAAAAAAGNGVSVAALSAGDFDNEAVACDAEARQRRRLAELLAQWRKEAAGSGEKASTLSWFRWLWNVTMVAGNSGRVHGGSPRSQSPSNDGGGDGGEGDVWGGGTDAIKRRSSSVLREQSIESLKSSIVDGFLVNMSSHEDGTGSIDREGGEFGEEDGNDGNSGGENEVTEEGEAGAGGARARDGEVEEGGGGEGEEGSLSLDPRLEHRLVAYSDAIAAYNDAQAAAEADRRRRRATVENARRRLDDEARSHGSDEVRGDEDGTEGGRNTTGGAPLSLPASLMPETSPPPPQQPPPMPPSSPPSLEPSSPPPQSLLPVPLQRRPSAPEVPPPAPPHTPPLHAAGSPSSSSNSNSSVVTSPSCSAGSLSPATTIGSFSSFGSLSNSLGSSLGNRLSSSLGSSLSSSLSGGSRSSSSSSSSNNNSSSTRSKSSGNFAVMRLAKEVATLEADSTTAEGDWVRRIADRRSQVDACFAALEELSEELRASQ